MLTITTTNNLDGYEVVEYLGIVTGEAVSGINMFRDIGAGPAQCLRRSLGRL